MQQVPTQTTTTYTPGAAWTYTPVVSVPRPSTGLFPAGPSCQPCPDCGGLECLCRPRFFAGQLLTEQDLNRLENYIVAKNQLHNRYLVGHGVVCGLEVTCSPCANTLTVSSGYAIDPCGNDIIVCSPDTVDICKLIRACTPSTQVNCAPYKDNTACKDSVQEWILAIRYQESPSRGITPLTGSSQCSCGAGGNSSCTCGAVSKQSCGCGSMLPPASCCGLTATAAAAPVSTNRPRRGAPSVCEPTLTCETYCYEVFPAPPAAETVRPAPVRGLAGLARFIGGDMFERITCCVQAMLANMPSPPKARPAQDRVGWSNFCCNLRLALMQYVAANGATDCELMTRLRAINCPGAESNSFAFDLRVAFKEEMLVAAELLLNCLCSAALPPCEPAGDPRVPLASVRVRASDCTVLSVCDWTPLRKHVVTTKTLGYWLGWLPFVPMIREFMQEMCCGLFGLREQLGRRKTEYGMTMQADTVETKISTDTVGEDEVFGEPITFGARSYTASNPVSEALAGNLAAGPQSLNVQDLANALFGSIDPGSAGAGDNAKALAESPHARVLAEIARPLMNSFGPLIGAAMGNFGGIGGETKANEAELSAMRSELDSMKTALAQHRAALDALQQNPPPATKS